MGQVPLSLPILQHVFHPSDFSAASDTAFAHALKVALTVKATLTIFHVSPDQEEHWTEFPGVRRTLEHGRSAWRPRDVRPLENCFERLEQPMLLTQAASGTHRCSRDA